MSDQVPSNKFLNTALRGVAQSVIAASYAVETAIEPLRTMLTHNQQVPGQSPAGVNPTCDDVFNQVDHPTIELVDRALTRVSQVAASVAGLYQTVYPRVHQTHWERRRQSQVHRASTPATYSPP